MNLKNMIWLGESVLYKGKNAVVIDIDVPNVFINTGSDTIKVRFDKLKKINRSALLDIRNN